MPERTPRQIYATQKRALTSMQKKLEAMASQWADIDNGTMWALQELVNKIEAASHELTISLPPEPVWLHGDFTRLSQVVSNLLANAAKYTPCEGRIHLSVAVEQEEIRIDVADNGIGRGLARYAHDRRSGHRRPGR